MRLLAPGVHRMRDFVTVVAFAARSCFVAAGIAILTVCTLSAYVGDAAPLVT